MNLYYFFQMYSYVFFVVLSVSVLFLLLIFILDFLKPSLLEDIDQGTTLELFDELQSAHRDQDAVDLLEFKGGMLKGHPDESVYKCKLSESYIKIGDFSKAEKILLDVWNDVPDHLNEISSTMKEKYPFFEDFYPMSIARFVYQMYERMEDEQNQIKFFNIYKKYYDRLPDDVAVQLTQIAGAQEADRPGEVQIKLEELVKFDSIVVASFYDRRHAISTLDNFINTLVIDENLSPGYVIRCLNKLIEWEFSEGLMADAFLHIKKAVNLIPYIRHYNEYEGLGELSDYCYRVHDIELSRELSNLYQQYLDKFFTKTDFVYLQNYERTFRYLEHEGKIQELKSLLIDYSEGMRKQISTNLSSMSEEQREYFAGIFDSAYERSFNLLVANPDQELANVCFDNLVFRNGLLLRSDLQLKRRIAHLNDPAMLEKYEELVSLRRELVYQSVSGKKLFNPLSETQRKIGDLEKELALVSTDFKSKDEQSSYAHSSIQDQLLEEDAVLQLVENSGSLIALVLKKHGDVKYFYLGQSEILYRCLRKPISEIYLDTEISALLLDPVLAYLDGCENLYYVPTGVFTQIALGSLCLGYDPVVGTKIFLSDSLSVKLLSNPDELLLAEQSQHISKDGHVSLWGGIDYGGDHYVESPRSSRSAIKRGQSLSALRYARKEVDDISDMLSASGIGHLIYTDSLATEKSFKNRTGKDDMILHVSTHGYFAGEQDHDIAMLESGLFFSGANKFWTDNSLSPQEGEEDGILRAAEISTLNLSACSLVVLSACETGLGYSNSSEGVYGLQRAFKLAGVDQILMSLWDVDDRATSILMTQFYRNLLDGHDTDAALWKAQQTVRSKFPSPEDWGAFVLLH